MEMGNERARENGVLGSLVLMAAAERGNPFGLGFID
jgi:hypothetical protein